VLPIPGASSAVVALSVAGDTVAQGFAFSGFLPTKAGERRTTLQGLLLPNGLSQVIFEAPHRVLDLIALLAELAPERRVSVCRELTKQFESVHTALAAELPAWMAADAQRQRGEFVLVLHAELPRSEGEVPAEALRALQVLAAELPLKQAVALAAQLSGAPRNALYQAALELKRASGED
jgi:16S rRNA (cytidine1402-2'-O)-methyltransferase